MRIVCHSGDFNNVWIELRHSIMQLAQVLGRFAKVVITDYAFGFPITGNFVGDVLFDVKCTRHLNDIIASYGGRPIMCKSGHSLVKQKMVETGALLGGEYSGHIFFKERWFGFDDGLYSAARLIEIMSTTNPDLDQLLEQFPNPRSTPELYLDVGDERKFDIVERFAAEAEFANAKVSNIDGVRVDLPEGWGLLRASNTTPRLVLRFEAESDQALSSIKLLFQQQLQRFEPELVI